MSSDSSERGQGEGQGQSPVSPLEEVSPQSLGALFNADPLSLSDQDIEKIVLELRCHRELFLKAEAQGQGSKVRAPVTAKTIEDLGL